MSQFKGVLILFSILIVCSSLISANPINDEDCTYEYQCLYRLKFWPNSCLRWHQVQTICDGQIGATQPDHIIQLSQSELTEIREHNHIEEGEELATENVVQAVNADTIINNEDGNLIGAAVEETETAKETPKPTQLLTVPVNCAANQRPDKNGKCREVF